MRPSTNSSGKIKVREGLFTFIYVIELKNITRDTGKKLVEA